MNITDILNNLPEKANNSVASKMNKKNRERRIERRIEDIVSEILDFVSGEYNLLNDDRPTSPYLYSDKLSPEDRKELTNILISKVKSLPDKIKSELDDFFKGTEETGNKDESKDATAEITVTTVPEAPKPLFNY